jgi:hypothetical protein
MAYTNFTPKTHVQEAQDAQSFKIWDESAWNGESALTTICYVTLFFINDSEVTIEYDPYPLISGVDTAKYLEYLDRDGHIIDIADLTIGGAAAAARFEDGYYIARVTYSEGSYAVGSEPYYDNNQAFLAHNRCMKRKMPAKLLSWSVPITDLVYQKNRDIFLQGLYLESAENAVDLGKKVQFRSFMASVKAMFNYYEIEECW